jgi:hypothetical protein
MAVTRADRTHLYRITVHKQWSARWCLFINENSDEEPWDGISRNPNLTIEFIKENLDNPWNWSELSCNPNLTIEFINANPDKPWDWDYISMNPNITMEMINSNLDKPWSWKYISRNPNLTMEMINSNPDKPWDRIWVLFTMNYKPTAHSVQQLKQNGTSIAGEPERLGSDVGEPASLTMLRHSHGQPADCNWHETTETQNLTMEMINANPDKPWNWYWISYNPNLTIEMINANPDKPWNWHGISRNPNITMEDIKSNPNKPWVWNMISTNKFTRSKQEFIYKKYIEYLAAYRIQQWWYKLRFDPYHPIGSKRLEREYDELCESVPFSVNRK